MCLNAFIWLVLAVSSLLRLDDRPGSAIIQSTIVVLIPLLMGGNAAALLAVALGINWRIPIYYFLSLLLLAVNILLTFTDQFGALDFITLVIDLVLVGLLLAGRGDFIRR